MRQEIKIKNEQNTKNVYYFDRKLAITFKDRQFNGINEKKNYRLIGYIQSTSKKMISYLSNTAVSIHFMLLYIEIEHTFK